MTFRRRTMFMEQEGAGGGGGGAVDWRSALPETIRAAPALKDVKDVAGLAQAFVDTKALVGGSIRIPGQDAGADARKEFVSKLTEKVPELVYVSDGDDDAAKAAREALWNRLGKPKDAKEYTLEGMQFEPGVEVNADELRQLATEAGLTKSQFKALAKLTGEGKAAALRAANEAQGALKKELGAAYDERIATVATTAEKLGFPPALVGAVKAGAVDLATFKALAAVAKGFGQQRELAGQGGGAGGAPTPAEALVQRTEIRGRKEFWDRSLNPALSDQLRAKDLALAALAFPE